jgi:hypothetical protein
MLMGGLCRFRARGILFMGAVIVLVPFVHFGSSSDRASSLAEHRPSRVTAVAEAPVVEPDPERADPLPDRAGLHLVVAD